MTISKYIHPNGTKIPLEKICGECGGKTIIPNCAICSRIRKGCEIGSSVCGKHGHKIGLRIDPCADWKLTKSSISDRNKCPLCHDTGKIWIYYTPQQIEELTGEKLPDDTAILLQNYTDGPWKVCSLDVISGIHWPQAIVAFPYQPKPPTTWSPS